MGKSYIDVKRCTFTLELLMRLYSLSFPNYDKLRGILHGKIQSKSIGYAVLVHNRARDNSIIRCTQYYSQPVSLAP